MPPLWWICAVVIIVGAIFYYFSTRSDEKSAFKDMVRNPDDDTVLEYIRAFQSSQNIITTIVSMKCGFGIRGDRDRQAQGYEIVRESPNVSEEVKTELYNTLVGEGVPVSGR